MPNWLAATGHWCAICALALLFLITAPISWLLTLAGNGTLGVAEWARDRLKDLMAEVRRG